MDDKKFNEQHEAMKRLTRPLRESGPGPGSLSEYTAEVIDKVRERQHRRLPVSAWALRGAVACAVLVLAAVATLRGPLEGPRWGIELAAKPSVDALAEEIATLKALGEWSEEEDLAVFNEIVAEDLDSEISYGPRRSATG